MNNLNTVIKEVEQTCIAIGRDPADIEIELAVKTRTAQECLQAADVLEATGRPALLAHNRVQEAVAMLRALKTNPRIHLSLIGPLQSNKINQALTCFDTIETIASEKLAHALAKRHQGPQPLPILIQVNTSAETTKHGLSPDDAIPTALAISEIPNLQVQGFMTIGAHSKDETLVRRSFRTLKEIRNLARAHHQLQYAHTLSMGMSSDYRIAIEEGATRIRIGSLAFGPRS